MPPPKVTAGDSVCAKAERDDDVASGPGKDQRIGSVHAIPSRDGNRRPTASIAADRPLRYRRNRNIARPVSRKCSDPSRMAAIQLYGYPMVVGS